MVLICISLMVSDLFIYLLAMQMSSLREMSIQVLCHFLIRLFGFLFLLNCGSFQYILDINPLSDMWFANIFSLFIVCIFILLIVSFALQKCFSLMLSHLFSLACFAFAFGVKSKKIINKNNVKKFTAYIFFKSFMVSGLTSL